MFCVHYVLVGSMADGRVNSKSVFKLLLVLFFHIFLLVTAVCLYCEMVSQQLKHQMRQYMAWHHNISRSVRWFQMLTEVSAILVSTLRKFTIVTNVSEGTCTRNFAIIQTLTLNSISKLIQDHP